MRVSNFVSVIKKKNTQQLIIQSMKSTKQIMRTLTASQLLDDAKSYIALGEYYEALHAVNAFLLFQPHHHEGILMKGLCYLYLNENDKARFLFDLVIDEDQNCAFAYYCYAEYYKLNMDYQTALTYINGAIATGEENTTYYRLAAEISFFMQSYDDAFAVINRAIVVNPFREDLYLWRAVILEKFGKITVAVNDLHRAISINPKYVEAYRMKAKLMLKTGNTTDALNDLHKAQQLERLLEQKRTISAYAA
jgi:tetratricopeptide (TPR) repeat protein